MAKKRRNKNWMRPLAAWLFVLCGIFLLLSFTLIGQGFLAVLLPLAAISSPSSSEWLESWFGSGIMSYVLLYAPILFFVSFALGLVLWFCGPKNKSAANAKPPKTPKKKPEYTDDML